MITTFLSDAESALYSADPDYNDRLRPLDGGFICGMRYYDHKGRPEINWWYDPPYLTAKCYERSTFGRTMWYRPQLELWRCEHTGCQTSYTMDEVRAMPINVHAMANRTERRELLDIAHMYNCAPWSAYLWRAWHEFLEERKGT